MLFDLFLIATTRQIAVYINCSYYIQVRVACPTSDDNYHPKYGFSDRVKTKFERNLMAKAELIVVCR